MSGYPKSPFHSRNYGSIKRYDEKEPTPASADLEYANRAFSSSVDDGSLSPFGYQEELERNNSRQGVVSTIYSLLGMSPSPSSKGRSTTETISLVMKGFLFILSITLVLVYLSTHTVASSSSSLSTISSPITKSVPAHAITPTTEDVTTPAASTSPVSPSKMSFTTLQPTVTLFTPGYEVLPAVSYLPWDVVAEPFKAQNLSVSLSIVSEDSTSTPITLSSLSEYGIEVVWTVEDNEYVGESVLFTENRGVGVYDCTLTIRESSSSAAMKTAKDTHKRNPLAVWVLRNLDGSDEFDSHSSSLKSIPLEISYTFTMAVKYIRRELRSLSDIDRDNILTAMRKLYSNDTVSTSAKYMSMERFLYYHLQGAGTSDCDHWHDGAGIITHHAAITLAFEQALQTIDQTIALPYWEYTKDTLVYANGSYQDSSVFFDNWFGSASPTSEDHSLDPSSRFGNILTPNGTSYANEWEEERASNSASVNVRASLNPFVNPYGYMRTPWNMNTSPYFGRRNLTYNVQRYTELPTCDLMELCYESESMADLFKCTNGGTHGPVHIMIGGSWTDESLPTEYYLQHSQQRVLLFKILWRTGITRCPTYCDINDTCRCGIPQALLDKYTPSELLDKALMRETLAAVLSLYDYDLDTFSESEIKKILLSVENVDQAGEMFTSAASWDPIFWPLHGSIERLLGFKRMNVEIYNDTAFDSTWAFPEYDPVEGPYLDGYCDWSKVELANMLSLPECYDGMTCPGHYEDDLLEFTNFLNEGESYTNAEMLAFIHPWNDHLPYCYDTYRFDYCREDGVVFVDETVEPPTTTDLSRRRSLRFAGKEYDSRVMRKGKKVSHRVQEPKRLQIKGTKKTKKEIEYLSRTGKTLPRTKPKSKAKSPKHKKGKQ